MYTQYTILNSFNDSFLCCLQTRKVYRDPIPNIKILATKDE